MKKITMYCNGTNAVTAAKRCSTTSAVKILNSQTISEISHNPPIVSKADYYNDKIAPIVASLNIYIDTMSNKVVDTTDNHPVYTKMYGTSIVSMNQIHYNPTNSTEV